jgi:hypothetical protein
VVSALTAEKRRISDMKFVASRPDLAAKLKLDGQHELVGVLMDQSDGLFVCETMLARLDVALQTAANEVACASAAEKRIRRLVARLTEWQCGDVLLQVIRPPSPNLVSGRCATEVANENLRECVSVVASGLGAAGASQLNHRSVVALTRS